MFTECENCGTESLNGRWCFPCDVHLNGQAYNVYVPRHDRYRLFRNPHTGTRYSYALGQDMPETAGEYHRICEQKGIEPVSPSTMPEQWKAAAEYARHVKQGGDRVDPASVVPKEPITGVKSVRDMVRENPQKFRTA